MWNIYTLLPIKISVLINLINIIQRFIDTKIESLQNYSSKIGTHPQKINVI